MSVLTKRQKLLNEQIDWSKKYTASEAVRLLKSLPPLKFKETVDAQVCLGVDPKKNDEVVRGSIVLPHGTGRNARVLVFAQSEAADAAKAAGADQVGSEVLVEEIKSSKVVDFDVVIATPDMMPIVSKLGKILGPRGLMPNPKVGTVSADPVEAVKRAKAGQVVYKTDRAGIVACPIGKIDFSEDALVENLMALMTALKKAKPVQSKGVYLKRLFLSTTMGPGLMVDFSTLAF